MNRGIKVSGGILLGIVAIAFIGPLLSPHEYQQTNFDSLLQSPALSDFHIFGTDDLGRDLFVRSMIGVQITILVAIVASVVSLLIGVAYGAIAGYLIWDEVPDRWVISGAAVIISRSNEATYWPIPVGLSSRITPTSCGSRLNAMPSWSPDGSRIVFGRTDLPGDLNGDAIPDYVIAHRRKVFMVSTPKITGMPTVRRAARERRARSSRSVCSS